MHTPPGQHAHSLPAWVMPGQLQCREVLSHWSYTSLAMMPLPDPSHPSQQHTHTAGPGPAPWAPAHLLSCPVTAFSSQDSLRVRMGSSGPSSPPYRSGRMDSSRGCLTLPMRGSPGLDPAGLPSPPCSSPCCRTARLPSSFGEGLKTYPVSGSPNQLTSTLGRMEEEPEAPGPGVPAFHAGVTGEALPGEGSACCPRTQSPAGRLHGIATPAHSGKGFVQSVN